MNFKLSDVTEGGTVIQGTVLGGVPRVVGLVTRILPGQGFEVDDGIDQQSILVRDCRILEGEEATVVKAILAAAVGKLRRTDSTLKPGQPLYGVVDHEWWAAEGVEPDFAVFAEGSVVADMAIVLDHERQAWGPECAAERAWQRQMARLRASGSEGGAVSPRSPLAPHRSPPLRPVTPQPRRQSGCLASAFPSVVRTLTPPPAPTRPAPNPREFVRPPQRPAETDAGASRPPPLNLEGLLATAVEDDEHRLAAPRHGEGAVTPTYSVSTDDEESDTASEAGFDTTPLRNAPPLPDEDADDEEQAEGDDCPAPDNTGLSLSFKGSITFPVWFLAALGGFAIAYLWMVAAFVSRMTARAT